MARAIPMCWVSGGECWECYRCVVWSVTCAWRVYRAGYINVLSAGSECWEYGVPCGVLRVFGVFRMRVLSKCFSLFPYVLSFNYICMKFEQPRRYITNLPQFIVCSKKILLTFLASPIKALVCLKKLFYHPKSFPHPIDQQHLPQGLSILSAIRLLWINKQ